MKKVSVGKIDMENSEDYWESLSKKDEKKVRQDMKYFNIVYPLVKDLTVGKIDMKELCQRSFKEFDSLAEQENKERRFCWNCHAMPSMSMKLLLCAGCRKARYCGEKCQAEDRSRHMNWCQRKEAKRQNKNQ